MTFNQIMLNTKIVVQHNLDQPPSPSPSISNQSPAKRSLALQALLSRPYPQTLGTFFDESLCKEAIPGTATNFLAHWCYGNYSKIVSLDTRLWLKLKHLFKVKTVSSWKIWFVMNRIEIKFSWVVYTIKLKYRTANNFVSHLKSFLTFNFLHKYNIKIVEDI